MPSGSRSRFARFAGAFGVVVMDFDQRGAAMNIDMLNDAALDGDDDVRAFAVLGKAGGDGKRANRSSVHKSKSSPSATASTKVLPQ